MPNRYNNIYDNAYVSTHVPLPFQEMVALGAMKQKQQDEAAAERAQLLGKTWNRLPGDAARSVEMKKEVDAALSPFVDQDMTDPQVRSKWYKTKVDLVNKFGPNGEIGAQEANYNAYKEYEKETLAKSKEQGWSADQLRSHLNQAKNSFMTRGEDGTLRNFQGKGLADNVDTSKWLKDMLPIVADDTGVTQLKKYGSLNQVTDAFVSGEINHKDYNKIVNSISRLAQGDAKLMAALEQQGAFEGKQGWSNFIKGQDKSGNTILDTSTPFGTQLSGLGLGAQYQKNKQNYMKVADPLELYKLKKQEEIKEMQFSIQGVPVDPNNPTNNDAGINTSLRTEGNPLGAHWEFKNGKLQMKNLNSKTKEVFEVNGKEYGLDNLPTGYKLEWQSGDAGAVPFAIDPKGKSYVLKTKEVTSDDMFNAFKELSQTASRLGIKGDRETVTKAVEDYYLTTNNFQNNFPKFDEGSIGSISKAFGVGMKNVGGEMVITNPGQLAFSTMKNLDGKPINEENLSAGNATRLSGAKILGPAQSLTNSNYEAGDMYVQSTDGNIYIMNTNNRTINDALAPTTKLTQSINKYVTTGKKDIDPVDAKKLESLFPGDRVVGSTSDKHGNRYYSYVNTDANGKVQMGAIKVLTDGTPVPMGLDEATKQISETNMKEILPEYNIKNFDRISKAMELDTEDDTEE